LLGLSRSSLYYEPGGEAAEDLRLMRFIDELYTARPFYGSRRMTIRLNQQGEGVNRKRVQRLMRVMGLEAIYPKPRLSLAGKGHRIYPYLLRGVTVERRDQVWSTDITYVPMASGFMYLAAVIDWFSRYVITWRLSNTFDGGFCLEMLDDALRAGKPEVFNTDQGVQFTAAAFTGRLEAAGVVVEVRDDGCGIRPEHRSKLFEPFFTTKPAGRGTGLGLSMVHGIVHQHGGFLEVSSRVGRGTTFTLFVPAA
jgi:putative transposase